MFVFRSSLSVGSMIDGVPEVPLAEAPTIVTSAGNFRLSYTDLNKLSYRRISRPEYSGKILRYTQKPEKKLTEKYTGFSYFFSSRDRENSFVNDAIITERKRTKYKDIIPKYSADRDKHCFGLLLAQPPLAVLLHKAPFYRFRIVI